MNYKIDNIKNYSKTKGWLCGQFFPNKTINQSSNIEVKFSILNTNDNDSEHYHPQGEEIIIIVKGKVKWQLNKKQFILKDGDFIIMKNNVKEAIIKVYEETKTISIRTPSVKNNKIYTKK